MPHQSIEENVINGAGTCEGVKPGRLEVLSIVPVGCHHMTDPKQGRKKGKEEKNVAREYWIRSNPTGPFPASEQKMSDQARQIPLNR